MSDCAAYRYSHIEDGSIRLLKIEKAGTSSRSPIRGDTDWLRCIIQDFPLSKARYYRALSYAWDGSKTDWVYVNEGLVQVRKNLWEALWYLRATNLCVPDLKADDVFTEKNTRWIWIDALCIDQSNTERNHQVRMMGSIYKTAVEALARLGYRENLPFGSRVPTAVLQLAAFAADDDPVVWRKRVHRFGIHNFLHLFALQYWQRMWILQEIRLASMVTLLFDTLTASCKGLERLRETLNLLNWIESKIASLQGDMLNTALLKQASDS